jgi:hypothetical protein
LPPLIEAARARYATQLAEHGEDWLKLS